MPHGKTVHNKTGHDLNIRFTVRNGDEPFTQPPFGGASADIDAGENLFLAYGNDANPYLDAIDVAVSMPNGSAGTHFAAGDHRGAPGDTAMNTNDTVTVSLADNNVHLEFSNGG